MRNKHGVKITKAERDYYNSLKSSIRIINKRVESVLEEYKQHATLVKEPSKYTRNVRKYTVHSFESREQFLREVEHLTKVKSEMSTYKTQRPKQFDELPKRLQNRIEIESRRQQKTMIKRNEWKTETSLDRILNISYINKRNDVYRDNLYKAMRKTFNRKDYMELKSRIGKLTESDFMQLLLQDVEELIHFTYYDSAEVNVKVEKINNLIDKVEMSK